MVEQDSFTCAYVSEDLSTEKSKDSFIVVLGHTGGSKHKDCYYEPKLLKFIKLDEKIVDGKQV